MPDPDGGFGIYIHWPFCQSKCPYCDFNSHVIASVDQRAWAKAFVSELEKYASETPQRIVNSIFFGGGTPSLMEPSLVETILVCISEHWSLARDVEITLEANPTSVEARKFRDFRASGVNRVSVGIQALNDNDLTRLGRRHNRQEALAAIDLARTVFLQSSFDLIYARQDQTVKDWQAELSLALSLDLDHLSLYQLTIEPETAFGKLFKAGKLGGLPADTVSADLYQITQMLCEDAGLPAYEVSNHAKPWAQSKHNLIYWRAGDFIGVGPGAHGRLTIGDDRFATETPLDPAAWLASAMQFRGECARQMLSPDEQVIEYIMMSLRLAEGLEIKRLQSLGGSVDWTKIHDLAEQGLVGFSTSHVWATNAGRMVLNAIIREFIE